MADEVNILAQAKPSVITLGDGKEYILSPVNLNILADLEEEFGCGLEELRKKSDRQSFLVLRNLLFVFLRENYPTLTKRQIGKLVTVKLLPEISKVMGEIWGRL